MARDRSKEKPAGPGAAPEPEPDDVRYGAAVVEIEQILTSIDRDEIDIDELSQKVERAVVLLKLCRARLRATETRVTQVLQELAAEEAAEARAAQPAAPDDAAGSEARNKDTDKDTDKDTIDDEELPF